MNDDALIRESGPKPSVQHPRNYGIPRYKCHKEVQAARIKAITNNFRGIILQSMTLTFEEPGAKPETVSAAWAERNDPRVGGYFVVYVDGYTSFSPGKAFEDGYTRISL